MKTSISPKKHNGLNRKMQSFAVDKRKLSLIQIKSLSRRQTIEPGEDGDDFDDRESVFDDDDEDNSVRSKTFSMKSGVSKAKRSARKLRKAS